ncbi:MAG: ATP synthase F1 subunit delta, partial [Nitrospinales bacterium]
MIENIIGKRYARALSATLENDSALETVLRSVKSIGEAFQVEPQLTRFFAHPGIPRENKISMVNDLCDRVKAQTEVRKLLTLLVERKKILFLNNIAEHFEEVVDQRLSQARAVVVSAYPMTGKNQERLETSQQRNTGKKVLVEMATDESLIAG